MKRILVLVLLLCLAPVVMQDRGHLYFMTLIMIWCVFAIGYDRSLVSPACCLLDTPHF
jgi:hypothetical protein